MGFPVVPDVYRIATPASFSKLAFGTACETDAIKRSNSTTPARSALPAQRIASREGTSVAPGTCSRSCGVVIRSLASESLRMNFNSSRLNITFKETATAPRRTTA